MKYVFLSFIATALLINSSNAQQSNESTALLPVQQATAPIITWFSAEGNSYYLAAGLPAASSIAWYSQRWGGKRLKISAANTAGELRIKESKDFKPAFALSIQDKGGNGMVGFTEAAEFTLDNVKASAAGGIVTVKWQGTVAAGKPIVFEVLKAAPGMAYNVAGSFQTAGTDATQPFTFIDAEATPNDQYRIRVRNEAAGERYLSRSLLQGTDDVSAIYPTVVSDALTIDTKGVANAYYTITGTDGRVAAEGLLQTGFGNVSIAALATGNYMVCVRASGKITTAMIVKK